MTEIVHSNRKRRWFGALCVVGVLALGTALAPGLIREHETTSLPTGSWLYGDAASLAAIFESLESWQGTPMADAARALRERMTTCVDVVAHVGSSDLSRLVEEVRCASRGDVPEPIAALRGAAALGFALEVAPGTHVSGNLARDASGALTLDATVATPEARSLAALLVPGEKSPGPPSLSAVETLLHARVRPHSGLNIADLVAEDSQADNMFRLRSELFLGQVLDGTWEVAIYLPRTDQVTPPMALALDYTLRSAARAAMETFVAELESTWPIHHSGMSTGGFDGACFHDVKLLPDLAPCYVLTDQSIVVGWNAASLELALGLGASSRMPSEANLADGASIGADGGLVLHLDRLPEADLRLQQQLMRENAGRALDYVWDELRIEGANDGDALNVRVSLAMDGASS